MDMNGTVDCGGSRVVDRDGDGDWGQMADER